MAPPEILEWDRGLSFRFSVETLPRGGFPVTSPDLRLDDYLRKARRRFGEDGVTFPRLQSGRVIALDGSGSEAYSWSVWKRLTGAVDLGGETFVLDEGQFFRVHQDYMEDLDSYVDQLPNSSLSLPPNPRGQEEGDYNAMVASSSSDLLLLDRQNVKVSTRTTPIEICDLLTRDKKLEHAKRHFSSSNLSHLFAQGVVLAHLLQSNPDFRSMASTKIVEAADGITGFEHFSGSTFAAQEFEVVYAIAAPWGERPIHKLAFLHKVNLRRAAKNLRSRGFEVALDQIVEE